MQIDEQTLIEWRDALRTQYQLQTSAIIPRTSVDAPSIKQLSAIRDAHLSIFHLVNEIIALRRVVEQRLTEKGYL